MARLGELADVVARVLEERAVQGGRAEGLHDASERAQEEFLSLVSHELRTPLNGIVGLCELLDPGEGDRELLDGIRASGALMTELVDSVIAFADLRAGRIEPREATTPASELLAEVARSIGPRVVAQGGPPPELGACPALAIRGDRAMLTLALNCLATNAFAHGAGAMRLSVREEPDGVALMVEDDGPRRRRRAARARPASPSRWVGR